MGIWVLLAIGYLITGSVEKASLISITFHIIRLILYYVHERLWLKTKWGLSYPVPMRWFWLSLLGVIISFLILGLWSI